MSNMSHKCGTIAPKLLYGQKECDLATLLTPLVIRVLRYSHVHHCGTGGSMCACHSAGPGSIPGRDKFPR